MGGGAGVPRLDLYPLFVDFDRSVHCLAGPISIRVSVLYANGSDIACIGWFSPGDIKPPFQSMNDG